MKTKAHQLTLFAGLLLLAGCASGKFTRCIFPQVSGRVLAADTHQPLANVQVQRVSTPAFQPFGPPKTGQAQIPFGGVQTDADGRYELPGENVLSFFRQAGWWSVPVSYRCAGYETIQTNYTGANFQTNSGSTVNLINVGDILMQPKKPSE